MVRLLDTWKHLILALGQSVLVTGACCFPIASAALVKVTKSTLATSRWAPGNPEEQDCAGVDSQDEEVQVEEEPVHLRAERQPVHFCSTITLHLVQVVLEGDDLLQNLLQLQDHVLGFTQGQEVLLQMEVKVETWNGRKIYQWPALGLCPSVREKVG